MTQSQIALITTVIITITTISFIIQCIVELTKSLPGIKKIPTQLYTIIISASICTFVYFGYTFEIEKGKFDIIKLIGAWIVSFPISYFSMNGYEKTKSILDRVTLSPKEVEETIESITKLNDNEK